MKALLIGLFLVAAYSLLGIPAAQGQATGATEKRTPIRLGVSLPLTGESTAFGEDARNALQMALEDVGQGHYEVTYEDDKCDALQGVTIAQKFAAVNQIQYAAGFVCSVVALAASPIYEQRGIPIMTVGSSSPRLTRKGDQLFRSIVNDADTIRLLSTYLDEQKVSRVGILSAQTDFALDIRDALKKSFEGAGKELITDEYQLRATDFKSILLSMKRKGVEVLFINSNIDADFILVLKQVKALRWNVPILGVYYPGMESVLSLNKELTEGIVFSDMPTVEEISDERGQKLTQRMMDRFGKPKAHAMLRILTYEAFVLFDKAIKSGKKVGDFLINQSFDGVTGKVRFDENGDMKGLPYHLKKIENGVPKILK